MAAHHLAFSFLIFSTYLIEQLFFFVMWGAGTSSFFLLIGEYKTLKVQSP